MTNTLIGAHFTGYTTSAKGNQTFLKRHCVFTTTFIAFCFSFGGLLAQTVKPVYLDYTQPVEKRVQDLMSRMTLEEKAQFLNHVGPDITRFDIKSDKWNQSLHGVVWSQQPGPQRTTFFPVSIAMGATWNPKLMHEVATAISDEARAIYNWWHASPETFPAGAAKKGLIYRSPVINVERNPYWGRNEEAYSEDPFLTGRMGVAHIKGLQGNDPIYLKLASTLKHYAVNNVEYGRQGLSATVSERMLHEYWLPHFKDAIMEGGAMSVMASYNAINGVPSNINKVMLNDILRDKWGFKGFVVSDLGGVRSMVTQHTGGKMTYEDAVAQSIIAGCDFSDAEFMNYLPSAVTQGKLSMDKFNEAVFRVMRVRFLLGEFDPFESVPYSKIPPSVIGSKEHLQLALKAAQEAIVLLTNNNNALPLDKTRIKSIAVIGPMADQFTITGYSGRPMEGITPLQGIKNRMAPGTEVFFAKGSPSPPASRNPNPPAANAGGAAPAPVSSPEGRAQITMNSQQILSLNMTSEQRAKGHAVLVDLNKALDAANSQPDSLVLMKAHENRFTEVLNNDQKTAYRTAIATRPANVGFGQQVGGGNNTSPRQRAQNYLNGQALSSLNLTGDQKAKVLLILIEQHTASDTLNATILQTATDRQAQLAALQPKRLEIMKAGETKFVDLLTEQQRTIYATITSARNTNQGFGQQGGGGGGGAGQNANSSPVDATAELVKAAEAAKKADVVILYLGTNSQVEREGADRTSLGLPGNQEELFKTVMAANPKTIVVLMNAGPITMPYVKENAPAIIEAWWNGEQGANAIADVIFGNVNPGGKLPHTIYASESQVPSQDEYDISKGFTYMYLQSKPLFPFGHGLSYTNFVYSNLKIASKKIKSNGKIDVSVTIQNSGKVKGDEVVQLYVRDVISSVVRPSKELRGFQRITLSPGEKKIIHFEVPAEKLAFYDEKTHRFLVEPGAFEITIGSSSEDIRLQDKVEVVL